MHYAPYIGLVLGLVGLFVSVFMLNFVRTSKKFPPPNRTCSKDAPPDVHREINAEKRRYLENLGNVAFRKTCEFIAWIIAIPLLVLFVMAWATALLGIQISLI